jgi:Cysteine-rich CPCC
MKEIEIAILNDFNEKRELFDNYLKKKKLKKATCPGCSYPTLKERGNWDICMVCDWEDDGQDDNTEPIFIDFIKKNNIGEPNKISLIDNRIKIGQTLNEIAQKLNGQINQNPEQVMSILKATEKKKSEIYKSIPMSATIEHIGYKQVEDLSLNLLTELITLRIGR